MADTNLTWLVFLLDRSGSMQSIKSDVVGGFDAFLAEQRAGEGHCVVTLAQFDHEYQVVYSGLPLDQVPPLALAPRGNTALLDSMGTLITGTAAQIEALPEADRPGTVVVAKTFESGQALGIPHIRAVEVAPHLQEPPEI